MCHIIRIRHLSIADRHMRSHHRLHAPEQLLVLDLLVREANQPFERELVAKDLCTALLEHLGADEALDQSKDVGVGSALDLAKEARFIPGKRAHAIDQRQSVRQKLV